MPQFIDSLLVVGKKGFNRQGMGVWFLFGGMCFCIAGIYSILNAGGRDASGTTLLVISGIGSFLSGAELVLGAVNPDEEVLKAMSK
jgi:hypothetical protein